MLELTAELSRSLGEAAAVILRSSHLVVLAGAGLSVESDIPPFRGPGGLWTKYGEPTNLSYREFTKDPKEWWETRFRNEDRPGDPTYELKVAVDAAEPNPGHHALVEMEEMGLLKCVITQNVDNLHTEAGSKSLVELHGNRTWLRCVGCGVRQPRDVYHFDSLPPICTLAVLRRAANVVYRFYTVSCGIGCCFAQFMVDVLAPQDVRCRVGRDRGWGYCAQGNPGLGAGAAPAVQ